VLFETGAPDPTPDETALLTEAEIAEGYRLGCQTALTNDAVLHLSNGNGVQSSRILATGHSREAVLSPTAEKRFAKVPEPSTSDQRSDLVRVMESLGCDGQRAGMPLRLLRNLGRDIRRAGFGVTGVFSSGQLIGIEPGDTTDAVYGAAFDIGTTTIAGYLIDLNSGRQVSVASAMNPQAMIGDDVISRINYTMQERNGLVRLQKEVVGEINRMLDSLLKSAGVKRSLVYEVAIVGNTCMSHLFLGIDPRHLAVSPYVPTVSRSLQLDARDPGLRISRFGKVHVLPNIAGFVGGDTVGVVLATGLHYSASPVLAVDIGTNGEIVLGWKERMLACSTAAGPAFEGAHIKHGMRAAPGAIDQVSFEDGEIRCGTVGNARAVGICGSGLLDAVVCLCQAGIVECNGRIVDACELPADSAHLRDMVTEGERGNDYVLVPAAESGTGEPILVTQRDVREVQLAKGAIATGIRTLMEYAGIAEEDLESIVLAGAFGNYMRKESAVAAGLIPSISLDKIRSVGNAAGEGAKLALISTDMRLEADEIARSVEYIELTTHPGFQDRFSEELMFGCSIVG
jgi:uncharacterized 2Fe-2S/4Fe-4S cluster protein (DUF4445 family)